MMAAFLLCCHPSLMVCISHHVILRIGLAYSADPRKCVLKCALLPVQAMSITRGCDKTIVGDRSVRQANGGRLTTLPLVRPARLFRSIGTGAQDLPPAQAEILRQELHWKS